MARRLRIALLIGASRQYRRDLLRGIAAYARVHGPWTFYHEEQIVVNARPAWLKNWHGDGILARIESRKFLSQIADMDIPAVDLLGLHDAPGIPSFDNDTMASAGLAVDHFHERGFKHFAYCGLSGVHYSDDYRNSLVEYLEQLGHTIDVYRPPKASWRSKTSERVAASTVEAKGILHEKALGEWLKSLPKPLGLIACNDLRAHQVLNACEQWGIAVPDEVAVIGADNDEVLCELSNPPLSSVDPDAHRMGYEAAALLERMIDGEPVPKEKILVEPAGIIVRKSSDVTAIPDSAVAAALFYIREHACGSISVDDVLQEVRLSRSTLERRFTKYVGRSPKNEILRVQLRQVKQFLSETGYPLSKIARLSGFKHVENMCHFFKAKTGETPGQYRKQHRTRDE
ncbi:MAG: DNA-binding transcriptional regulator [Planctomycetota bacterium]|nr:DNA-binding transcriptional regulator [Planctomycetota bacterium]